MKNLILLLLLILIPCLTFGQTGGFIELTLPGQNNTSNITTPINTGPTFINMGVTNYQSEIPFQRYDVMINQWSPIVPLSTKPKLPSNFSWDAPANPRTNYDLWNSPAFNNTPSYYDKYYNSNPYVRSTSSENDYMIRLINRMCEGQQ